MSSYQDRMKNIRFKAKHIYGEDALYVSEIVKLLGNLGHTVSQGTVRNEVKECSKTIRELGLDSKGVGSDTYLCPLSCVERYLGALEENGDIALFEDLETLISLGYTTGKPLDSSII